MPAQQACLVPLHRPAPGGGGLPLPGRIPECECGTGRVRHWAGVRPGLLKGLGYAAIRAGRDRAPAVILVPLIPIAASACAGRYRPGQRPMRIGRVPAEAACEIVHKAFPRKRQGIDRPRTTRSAADAAKAWGRQGLGPQTEQDSGSPARSGRRDGYC